MRCFLGILFSFLAFPSLNAYEIDIITRSVHTYKKVETAFNEESHIKEINLAPRLWKSVDGKEKKGELLELIGPNKIVLKMESPAFKGIYNEYELASSKLAPEEREYVKNLYYKLKYDYFSKYAKQEGSKWAAHLRKLESQKQSIDADIRAIQKQKEAYLSSTTVDVDVIVNITNNYDFDGYSGWDRSSTGTATTSVSTNSKKSTKEFDDLIRRLEHKKSFLPRQIRQAEDAVRVNAKVHELAKQSKIKYQNARSNAVTDERDASNIKAKLKELKELYSEGLISKENYELKQRELLESQ